MDVKPAELMKEFVNSQKFSRTAEVMEAMKEMFRDVLQQVMEGELDETLGCTPLTIAGNKNKTTLKVLPFCVVFTFTPLEDVAQKFTCFLISLNCTTFGVRIISFVVDLPL